MHSLSTTDCIKLQTAIWCFNFLLSKPRDDVISDLKKKKAHVKPIAPGLIKSEVGKNLSGGGGRGWAARNRNSCPTPIMGARNPPGPLVPSGHKGAGFPLPEISRSLKGH